MKLVFRLVADWRVLFVEPCEIRNFSPRSWKVRTSAEIFATALACSSNDGVDVADGAAERREDWEKLRAF